MYISIRMKLHHTLFKVSSLLLALALCSCQGKEDPAYVPGSSQGQGGGGTPQKPEEEPAEADYSKLTAANHPRLLMNDAECASLKARIQAGTDATLVKMHNQIMTKAASNGILNGATIVYQLDVSGRRILNQAKDADERILHLAYAWRMTGEKKYLDAADKVLNTVCDFPDWNAARHFLDPCELATACALGYDWLYKGLADSTKAKIERSIQDFAFYPAQHKIWNLNFYKAVDNWNMVCNSGLCLGALAIYEKAPKVSKEILEASIASIPAAVAAVFPDAAFHEGYSYWSNVAIFQGMTLTVFEECLGTTFGMKQSKGWQGTSECRIFMEGIPNTCFDFSDCDPYLKPAPGQWYFAWAYDNPSAVYAELPFIQKGTYTSGQEGRFYPVALAWCSKMPDMDLSKVAPPNKRLFYGSGLVDLCMIRTHWDKSDADKYLGVKGGKANAAHNHMDAGSFVYDAFNVRWAHDLGLQPYTSLENAIKQKGGSLWDMTQNSLRWKVLRLNNRFHSTLTVNDEDHRVDGYASISGIVDTKNELGCTVDMTPVFGDATRSAHRTFSLKGDVLTITDEIQAPKTAQAKISWRMVTKATVTVEQNYIKLQMNGKTMYLKATSNGPSVEYATWPASWPTSPLAEYDAANPGVTIVGFNGTVTTGKTVTFTTTLSPSL